MKETAFDNMLNTAFTAIIVVGAVGGIAYYYIKKKYGDTATENVLGF